MSLTKKISEEMRGCLRGEIPLEPIPEHRMLKRMITSAYKDVFLLSSDLRTDCKIHHEYAREALDWFMSTQTTKRRGELTFLFEEVCEHLELEPGDIRRKVVRACKRKGMHLERLSSY